MGSEAWDPMLRIWSVGSHERGVCSVGSELWDPKSATHTTQHHHVGRDPPHEASRTIPTEWIPLPAHGIPKLLRGSLCLLTGSLSY